MYRVAVLVVIPVAEVSPSVQFFKSSFVRGYLHVVG